MMRVIKIFKNFEDIINLRDKYAGIKDLLKLVFLIIYTAHIAGCGFFLIAQIEEINNESNNTWISKQLLNNEDLVTNYISSLYWAVITLITIGYGDITPTSSKEKLYVIFISFISCGVYAYAINNVGLIIQEMSKKSKEFKGKMSLLTSHMKKRGLSQQLQLKVKKYFEYINKEKLEDNEEGEALLNQLNNSLKNDVKQEIFGKILQQYKLFQLNFSSEFLQALAPKLKEKRYTPEEVIYQEQLNIYRRIYFLMKGKVDITLNINNKKKQYTIIESKQNTGIFGEYSFITGRSNFTGAISASVVSVVILEFEDFYHVIKKFPLDLEKFYHIKDSILFCNNTSCIGMKCQSCDSYRHNLLNCPYIKFIPNKRKLIYLSKISEEQKRNELFCRNDRKTESPLGYLDILQETLIQYLINNNPFDNLQQLLDLIEDIRINNTVLENNADQQDNKQTKQQNQQQLGQQIQQKNSQQNMPTIQSKNSQQLAPSINSLTHIQEDNNLQQQTLQQSQKSILEAKSNKNSSDTYSSNDKYKRCSIEINDDLKKLALMQQYHEQRRGSINGQINRRKSLFKQNSIEQRKSINMFEDVFKQVEINQIKRNFFKQGSLSQQASNSLHMGNENSNSVNNENNIENLDQQQNKTKTNIDLQQSQQKKEQNQLIQQTLIDQNQFISQSQMSYNQLENQQNKSDKYINNANLLIKNDQEFCFIAKFDKLYNFTNYFPKNNINCILKKKKLTEILQQESQNHSIKSKRRKLLSLMEQSRHNLSKKQTKQKLYTQKLCQTENQQNNMENLE